MTKCSNYEVASATGSGIRRVVAPIAAPGAIPALNAPYVRTVKSMLRRSLDRLRVGDVEPFLGIYAEDVRPVLSGRHSWAGDYRGEVGRWIRRFVRVGIQLKPHEILVTGQPWYTTACLRFTDRLVAPNGEVVYADRGTIFGKIVWGKLAHHEVNEDTQKIVELDEYLARHEERSRPRGARETEGEQGASGEF